MNFLLSRSSQSKLFVCHCNANPCYIYMSYLDTFYIFYFNERKIWLYLDDRKDLFLNKADFFEKKYKVDKCKYPQNLDKLAASSYKDKKNIKDCVKSIEWRIQRNHGSRVQFACLRKQPSPIQRKCTRVWQKRGVGGKGRRWYN